MGNQNPKPSPKRLRQALLLRRAAAAVVGVAVDGEELQQTGELLRVGHCIASGAVVPQEVRGELLPRGAQRRHPPLAGLQAHRRRGGVALRGFALFLERHVPFARDTGLAVEVTQPCLDLGGLLLARLQRCAQLLTDANVLLPRAHHIG
eukprot:CAMPEP_0118855404 /NCGR_PEP_ID=MMETSP1163-20130328/3233_1 /TAXON_ID=124430 /ORGANISM="Phaeomonas parva, Strain CCMP2877" /LENGTH=148 /DNA_ID=CAMNT_0006788287 /DNA_START=180 /DNA_END=627 /DNA_ORIENTATION=+